MKVSTNVVQRIYVFLGIINSIFNIKKGKYDMFKGVYWGISEEPLKGGRVVGGGKGGKGGGGGGGGEGGSAADGCSPVHRVSQGWFDINRQLVTTVDNWSDCDSLSFGVLGFPQRSCI